MPLCPKPNQLIDPRMKPFTRLFSSGVLSILSLLAPSSSSAAATTTYEVWRNSTSNDASTAQRIGDTASTSFTDRDVLPGRRYYYWGKARTSETVSGRYSNLLGAINLNLSMTVPTSAKRGAKSQINVEVDDGGIIPFVDVSGPLIVTVCEDDRFGFGLFGGVQEMSKKEEKNMRWDALTPLKKKYEFFIDIGSFEEGDANAEVFLKVLVDKSLQGPFFSFKPQAETATVNVALRDNYDPAPVIAASQGTQAGQVTLSWNATTGNSDFSLVSATGFAKSECYFLTRSVLPFGQGAIAVDSQPTPEGCYEAGKTITITAHPAAGYEFVSWSGDASGGRLATEILMDRNRAVTANFRLLSGRVIVQANPASGGSVSGDGEYQVGTRLQIAASPNSRWTFGGWSDGSKENPRDIIVALGTTTYTAIFSEIVRPPTITSQPVHRTVTAPQSATFAVEASGNPAPTYQWQRSVSGGAWGDLNNGATYSGVTTPTLTVGDTARTMSGHQFRVIASNGVNPSATSIPATLTVVDHPPGHPYENGQIVNGFQDSFNGPARDPRWVPFGTGGDLYQQANGVLHVTVRSGDPNHLLYVAPGYSSGVQEVLARIRVTDFGTGDPPRAGIGVGVDTSPAQSNRGLNLLFRDYTQDNVPGRQFKFLDDLRSWGPPGLRNVPGQTALGWQANTWYWLRVRLDPKMDGVNDLFGRVWAADGVTPEPSEWQMTWTDSSVPKLPKPLRSGYAGITGSSINGVAEFDVDYILIKAAGLPSIKVDTGRPDVGLRRELYLNIVGNSVDDLRNSPKFPNRPDRTDTVNTFESWDHNEVNEFEMYGQRLSGYILPPVTGNYVFYICSDDGSELWLSSDENPSTKRLIAREPEWHPARTWTGNARQSNRENVSQPIFLTYGKRYYVEALMKEGIIGDNLGVTWRKPGDPVPENGSPPIPGEYLRQFIQTDALIITAQPVAQTAYKGDCARFTVEASGREPLRYQWRFNGNELTGATDRVLTLCDTTPTKAGAYDVIVSDQLSRRTSQSAPLRIIDLPTITGPITNVANKHKYYLLDVSSWSAAEVAAKRLGGHLATINDQVEQEWVWSQFSKFGGVNRGLWIGLYDPDEGVNSPDPETRKREFVWASGERGVSYSNWRPSEPNNYQNLGEFYVAMWPPVDADGSLWNDFPGAWTSFLGASLNGVVEVAPTNTAPFITSQPVDRTVIAPQTAIFTVTASGNPVPTYQWQRSVNRGPWSNLSNDATYSGVTTPTLTVGNTARTMSGHQFRVIASNGVNPSATSIPATLTVIDNRVDLAIRQLHFLPSPILPGAHPEGVRFELRNVGSNDLNIQLMIAFYLSKDLLFSQSTNTFIGEVPHSASLEPDKPKNEFVDSDRWRLITIPEDAEGEYYVIAVVRAADGSPDKNPEDNIAFAGPLLVLPPPPVRGDFNQDKKADIVFQDAAGFLGVWFIDNATFTGGGYFVPNNVGDRAWRVGASSDFNRDDKEDLAFQYSDGSLAVWSMDGLRLSSANFLQPGQIDRNWKLAAAADFNADGKFDLVFQHDNGGIAFWLLDGLTRIGCGFRSGSGPSDPNWRVAGTGDFNRDGKADLLLQHTDGRLAVWYLSGTQLIQSEMVQPPHPGDRRWHAVGAGDRDGDGNPDVLFQHEDGTLALWYMFGARLHTPQLIFPPRPGGTWRVVAPR